MSLPSLFAAVPRFPDSAFLLVVIVVVTVVVTVFVVSVVVVVGVIVVVVVGVVMVMVVDVLVFAVDTEVEVTVFVIVCVTVLVLEPTTVVVAVVELVQMLVAGFEPKMVRVIVAETPCVDVPLGSVIVKVAGEGNEAPALRLLVGRGAYDAVNGADPETDTVGVERVAGIIPVFLTTYEITALSPGAKYPMVNVTTPVESPDTL